MGNRKVHKEVYMTDQTTPDTKSEKVEETKAPVMETTGKAEENKSQAPLNLPEKFQGKSQEEIVKMYSELEKKFGEHSDEVNQARNYLKEREVINKVLEKNPELYSLLEKELKSMYGTKDDGEVKTENKTDPIVTDLRRSEENRVVGDFQKNLGIDKMDQDKRSEIMKKVTNELAEMLDPGGTKKIGEIIASVSLSRLPNLLEKAYFLAYKDTLLNRGSLDEDVASIGSIAASSNGKSDNNNLTEHERKIAEKLGISPDKYLAQKKLLNK